MLALLPYLPRAYSSSPPRAYTPSSSPYPSHSVCLILTIVQSDPEGSLWRDPPNYFEQIVYPAYLKAHARIFKDGDTDNGDPTDKVENLLVINTNLSDGSVVGMDEIFDRASSAILEASRRTESTYGTQNGA